MKTTSMLLVCLLVPIALSGPAGAAEPHAHKSGHRHSHGEAELEIALEPGGRITGRLRGAMDAFLPFEHAPKTEAQRQQLSRLKEGLQQVSYLLSANPEAGCAQTSVRADSALFGPGPSVGGHSDLELQFTLQCAKPAELRQLSFDILKRPGRLKKIELEFVGPKGQAKAVLSPKSPVFPIP